MAGAVLIKRRPFVTIKDILQHKGSKVWSVKANQTIQEALQILVRQKIGAVLVLNENGTIAGILSERDIVRGCYQDSKGLDKTPVKELMTKNVITGSPEDNISNVMAVMTENRVRHIPVLADGKVAGIVSIGDVVKALLEDSEHQIRYLKEYLYGSNS